MRLVETGSDWSRLVSARFDLFRQVFYCFRLVSTGRDWLRLVETGRDWSTLVSTGLDEFRPVFTGFLLVSTRFDW